MTRAISSTRMMCVLVVTFAFAGIMPTASGDERPEGPSMVRHYRRAAEARTEALPIGNGQLGAMVFGGTGSERIALNEDTGWARERRDRNNPEALKSLPEIRRLLRVGKPAEAEALAEQTIIAVPKRLPPYQPLGDLRLRFPGHDRVDDYRRELDQDRAIVRVSYRVGDATFRREVFASAVDHVLIVRLTCDRPGRLTFSATQDREQDARAEAIAPDRVLLRGEAITRDERHRNERKVGVKFSAALRVGAEGGRVFTEGDRVEVSDADAATLRLVAATDFRTKDPGAACEQALAAADRPYARLRSEHEDEHRSLFRRVALELAEPDDKDDRAELPTDVRLDRVRNGESDPRSWRSIFSSAATC